MASVTRNAVGITSGPTAIDLVAQGSQQYCKDENSNIQSAIDAKAEREVSFPIHLLEQACAFKCMDGEASREADKEKIRKKIEHEAEALDNSVHGTVAVSALHRVLQKGGKQALQFIDAVRRGVKDMTINLPTILDNEETLAVLLSGPEETMGPQETMGRGPLNYKTLLVSTLCDALPAQLWRVQTLTSLDLRSPIKELPSSIADLRNLKYLTLRECKRLETLPDRMNEMSSLCLLNIRFCSMLTALPEALLGMVSNTYVNFFGCELELQPEMLSSKMKLCTAEQENLNSGTCSIEIIGVEQVMEWLEHVDWDIRNVAVNTLGQLPFDQIEKLSPLLLEKMDHVDWNVRTAAVNMIRKLPVARVLEVDVTDWRKKVQEQLISKLDDSDWHVRRAAVKVFGQLPVHDIEREAQHLLVCLDDREWSVRAAVISVLQKLPTPMEVAPKLKDMLEDVNADVRTAAVGAVNKLDTKKHEWKPKHNSAHSKKAGLVTAARAAKLWKKTKGVLHFGAQYGLTKQNSFLEKKEKEHLDATAAGEQGGNDEMYSEENVLKRKQAYDSEIIKKRIRKMWEVITFLMS